MYRGLILAGILLSLTTWAHADPLLTDFGIYTEPALPTMGAAGSTVVDPTFGTTIARITDASFGDTSCRSSYATVPSLNIDNTRIFVQCQPSSLVKFFDFNKTTMQVSNRRVTINSPTYPSNLTQFWTLWSGVNNYKSYSTNPNNIYEYNDNTDTFVQVNTATLVNGTNEFLLYQLSKSENDDIFADTYAATIGGAPIGYLIYKRSTDTVLAKVVIANLNEVELDKSGQWLITEYTSGSPRNHIRTVATGALVDVVTAEYISHKAVSTGFVVSGVNTRTAGRRNLVTPNTIVKLYPDNTFYYDDAGLQTDHYSGIRCNDKWVLSSRYSQNASAVLRAGDNEIFWMATDGSQRIRRIAHHRSINNTAIDIQYNVPFANSSRDGYFVAFSSNWGNTLGNNSDGQPRTDLFIVKVPRVNGALP